MGAICGVYARTGGGIPERGCRQMMDVLREFPHDTLDSWQAETIFLGNMHRYITPESVHEVLPALDETARIVLAADAIIDNRTELLETFGLCGERAELIPDSELIRQAYLKWGDDCPVHLIGDFAFVIWDRRTEELFCARDQVGKRTFYYYLTPERFAFSTLINPLLKVKEDPGALNERWIAFYFATNTPIHEFDIQTTIYQDIRQLPPAHTLRISKDAVKMTKYWDPLKLPKLKLRTDAEYEAEFRRVLEEAVRCRLRSVGPAGTMLSGGLDSGAVACIAAGQLAQAGKRLRSYTAVPFPAYQNWLNRGFLADEREYVQPMLDQYPNIDPTFCDMGGGDPYNTLDRLTALIEHPFKSIANGYWIEHIIQRASQDGCRILLDGQTGNSTISFGDLSTFTSTMLRRGKFLTLLRESSCYARKMKVSRKRILKFQALNYIPECWLALYRSLRKRAQPLQKQELSVAGLIHPACAARWQINEYFKKTKTGPCMRENPTIQHIRVMFMSGDAFSQVGAIETKLTLAYGIVRRDPTRDKRVIEFCLRLPPGQFVKDGLDRSLLRRALGGILPDKVRLNQRVRGRQSADYIQRLTPAWPALRAELTALLAGNLLDRYIDAAAARQLIEDMGERPADEQWAEMHVLLHVLAMGRFLGEMHSARSVTQDHS
ncbi:MAG: hypothetical protein LBT32_09380 [Peptococcaceae bacterium]|jgi:asparagine synthase (glutamine-hydrolysing)|nr:hypothetical protein [Peptococcaceae bacterium]